MYDAVDQLLLVGHKVVCVRNNLIGANVGVVYTVSHLDEPSNTLRLEEIGTLTYHNHSFVRLNKASREFNAQEKADQIMALINSKPRSPLKSEIIEVLERK